MSLSFARWGRRALFVTPLLLAACAPAAVNPAAPAAADNFAGTAPGASTRIQKAVQEQPVTTRVGNTAVVSSDAKAIYVRPPRRGEFKPMPYLTAAPQRQLAAPSTIIEPGRDYRAVLQTARGPITVDLDTAAAPQAVNNFVYLALNHFYDGTRFHRVIDGFMAQGGDPLSADTAARAAWGTGGPGYQFSYEPGSLSFNEPGILGMARSASPDSQGSQFFITLDKAGFLDGDYTAFGRVIEGMDNLRALTKTATSTSAGERPIPGKEADLLGTVQIYMR